MTQTVVFSAAGKVPNEIAFSKVLHVIIGWDRQWFRRVLTTASGLYLNLKLLFSFVRSSRRNKLKANCQDFSANYRWQNILKNRRALRRVAPLSLQAGVQHSHFTAMYRSFAQHIRKNERVVDF